MKKDVLKLLCDFGKQCNDLDQKTHQASAFPCLKHDIAVSTATNEVERLLHLIFLHLDADEDLINELMDLRKALGVIIVGDEEEII